MKERNHFESSFHRKVFEKCKLEDFASRHILIDEDTIGSKLNRFCPHIDMPNEPWYKVMNAYSDDHLRHSFSIEILTCFNKEPGYCKSKEEMEFFLENTYFTLYTISDMIDFSVTEI